MINFEHIAVGDSVLVRRGSAIEKICPVTRTTATQFVVEGFGNFWKKNGYMVGNASSWYGTFAYPVEPGDRERVQRNEWVRRERRVIGDLDVNTLNDDELGRIAAIVRESKWRIAKDKLEEQKS